MSKSAIGALMVMLLPCGVGGWAQQQGPSAPKKEASTTQSDADLVASSKKIAADYLAHFDTSSEILSLEHSYEKRYFELSKDFDIDVRKTDSLVSPYVGVLNFTLIPHLTVEHDTRAEAEADRHFVRSLSKVPHTHTYAFQDGKSVPKSRQQYLVDKWENCPDNR